MARCQILPAGKDTCPVLCFGSGVAGQTKLDFLVCTVCAQIMSYPARLLTGKMSGQCHFGSLIMCVLNILHFVHLIRLEYPFRCSVTVCARYLGKSLMLAGKLIQQ